MKMPVIGPNSQGRIFITERLMRPADFAEQLDLIADAYVSSGLLKSKPSLTTLIADLKASEVGSVDSFERNIRSGQRPKKPSTRRQGATAGPRLQVIEAHLRDLEKAGGDEREFNSALEDLMKDSKARVGKEKKEVLKRYSAGRVAAAKKAEMPDAFKRAFFMRVRSRQTGSFAEGASPL